MGEESRASAPGALRRVQEFINSEDLEAQTDELTTPEELASWLAERDLLEREEADAADIALAREVRSALRELALANNRGPSAPAAWEILNRVSAQAVLGPRFGPNGGCLEVRSHGVVGALGRLLGDVYLTMQDGTWARLKACRDDSCRWAFYDRSKNRSGAWCSMAECGNRAKTRTYRQRSRGIIKS